MSLIHADNLPPQPITDIFTSDTCIDRRKCHRTVPMKVLALGVGRTGTACMFCPCEIKPYTSLTICQPSARPLRDWDTSNATT